MPGQAPGPGQANSMPGMQPPMGGPSAGVVDLVGPLKNLPEQVLTMELLNPQSKLEKYAVLAALDQKNRERKTMQAVQNMQAMQQNAQMQGQGTIAQQVAQEAQEEPEDMQEPVMAALGGLMRSYAGGGIVAFTNGGNVENPELILPQQIIAEPTITPKRRKPRPDEVQAIVDEMRRQGKTIGLSTIKDIEEGKITIEDVAPGVNFPVVPPQAAINLEEMKRVREATQRGPTFDIRDAAGAIPQLQAQLQRVGPSERRAIEQQLEILRQRAATEPRPTSAVPTAAPIRDRSMEIASESVAAPVPAPAPMVQQGISITSGIPAALRERFEQRMQEETPKPASLTAAERGLDALLQARIAQEERFGREGLEETRRAAEQALTRSKDFGARDWFEIAASIDPRRGYELGSLGKGLSGVMGRQEQAREAARKELTAAQREQRQIDNRVAELRILAQQEQLARERGEFDRAEKIKDRRFTLEKELALLERGYEKEAADVAIRGKTAEAQMLQATKPSDLQEKVNLLKTDPATFNRLIPQKEKTDLIDYLKLQSQNLVGQLEGLITPQQRAPIEAQLNQINRALAAITGVGDVAPATGAVKPKSQAEFDALPKGARYINPSDGKEYIKN